MSPMALLLLLLVLAYIGSLWASSERKRAFGSPSGVEYVVLGLLLGPEVLGVLGQDAIATFEPIAIVALGWTGLIFGLECGMVGHRKAAPHRLALGILFTALTAAATAGACLWLMDHLQILADREQRLLTSSAVGLVSAETTRHAVRWIGERQPLSGPLADLLLDLAAADDAPVLLALAVLFAQLSGEHQLFSWHIQPPALATLTIGSGAALGVLAAWLMRHSHSKVERWTILLGAVWLVTGMTKSLGLSALSATFALGVTLSVLSPDATRLRSQIGQTEGAVLLPALLLAGAHLTLPASDAEIALIAAAIGMRLVMSLLLGYTLAAARRATRGRGLGSWLGAGMLASGTLTMIVAFSIQLRCPPDLARPALSIAFVGTLLGELVGPTALRRAFGRSSTPPDAPTLSPAHTTPEAP